MQFNNSPFLVAHRHNFFRLWTWEQPHSADNDLMFFTPFASKHSPEEVREGLTSAGAFLRGEVGRRLRLRHAPRLEFMFDDSFEKAAKLTALIDSAPK